MQYERGIEERLITQLVLNKEVRGSVRFYLQDWMFFKDAYKAVVFAICTSEFDERDPDYRILALKIKQQFKYLNDEDWSIILEILNESSPITSKEDITSSISIIEHFVREKTYEKGIDLYLKNEKDKGAQVIAEAGAFSIISDPIIDPTDSAAVQVLYKSEMPEGGVVIKSSLSLINSNATVKGWKYGDLAMIVAGPGSGKTTLMCQEGCVAAGQGFKVLHLAFGDMTVIDVIQKYISRHTGISINEVVSNFLPIFEKTKNEIFKNVRIQAYPALQMTVDQVVATARSLKKNFKFDMLFLDYDSNIDPGTEDSNNMYLSGGRAYSMFKALAATERCIIHVGCQSKNLWWDKEIIEIQGAAESSKKQHAVDYMITLGHNPNCHHVGTAFLAKVRRGQDKMRAHLHFDMVHSRIREIAKEEYMEIKAKFEAIQSGEVSYDESGASFSDPAQEK